jgi:hypothetical protein
VGRANLSELGKNPGFEIRNFGDGFDDKVNIGEIFKLCAGCEAIPGCGSIFFGDSAFAYVFFEELVGEFEALVNGCLGVVDNPN